MAQKPQTEEKAVAQKGEQKVVLRNASPSFIVRGVRLCATIAASPFTLSASVVNTVYGATNAACHKLLDYGQTAIGWMLGTEQDWLLYNEAKLRDPKSANALLSRLVCILHSVQYQLEKKSERHLSLMEDALSVTIQYILATLGKTPFASSLNMSIELKDTRSKIFFIETPINSPMVNHMHVDFSLDEFDLDDPVGVDDGRLFASESRRDLPPRSQ